MTPELRSRRGDVSALVTSGRQLHESGKYSPYGVPNSRPGADTDSDGDCDSTDVTQIQTWIDTSAYDVRGDVDLDGDVDSTDKTAAQNTLQGVTLGWGKQSADGIDNRRGFGAYEQSISGIMSIRHRHHEADLGRWSQRDPARYADGTNLYAYVSGRPQLLLDPFGLFGYPGQCGTLAQLNAWCEQHPESEFCWGSDDEIKCGAPPRTFTHGGDLEVDGCACATAENIVEEMRADAVRQLNAIMIGVLGVACRDCEDGEPCDMTITWTSPVGPSGSPLPDMEGGKIPRVFILGVPTAVFCGCTAFGIIEVTMDVKCEDCE